MKALTVSLLVLIGFSHSISQSPGSGTNPTSPGRMSEASDTMTVILFQSDPAGVDVYVDGEAIGKTPYRWTIDRSMKVVVRLFSPSVMHWMRRVAVDTIRISAGSRIEKQYKFDRIAGLYSVPSGAGVVEGAREIGTTPFIYRSRSLAEKRLVVRMDGFEEYMVPDLSVVTPIEPIRLTRLGIDPTGMNADLILDGSEKGILDGELVFVVAGTMITSGILAAYMKETGNRRFDAYLRTKDPSLLRSTRRYDKGAGVALAITQLSFAILSYLVLSE
ncbi:MAG: PEGA domain-containing protein [Ignavibacteria bacterium]|nr:PEGA domain-containing protein [Ignavibacteria bacterium]